MPSNRRLVNAQPVAYGSVDLLDGRAIYTDKNGTRWRMHDFDTDGSGRRSLTPGSEQARCRIYVREDGRERRRVLFRPRRDTLTASFNYHVLVTAAVRCNKRWECSWSVPPAPHHLTNAPGYSLPSLRSTTLPSSRR